MSRRDPVVVAWVVGAALAALAYTVGPQNFLFHVVDNLHFALFRLGEIVGELSRAGENLLRAGAIGLYATFLVLGLSVLRRGGAAKAALFWVSILFLFLIGGLELSTGNNVRWLLALLVAGAGAATMTQRLRQTSLAVR